MLRFFLSLIGGCRVGVTMALNEDRRLVDTIQSMDFRMEICREIVTRGKVEIGIPIFLGLTVWCLDSKKHQSQISPIFSKISTLRHDHKISILVEYGSHTTQTDQP